VCGSDHSKKDRPAVDTAKAQRLPSLVAVSERDGVSKKRAQRAGGMFDHPGRLLTGTTVIVALLWAGFTAGFKLHEMLVGLLATGLTVLFFANLLRTETLNLELRGRDLLCVAHVPASILKDCWIALVVLFEDLVGKRPAESRYVACGFKTGQRDPLLVGRSALAVTYATMSPNMIVIGIDPAQSLMLYHQLRRDRVPDFVRALGASDETASSTVAGVPQ
jgi:multisubunit Na+/H+ antiporter MnhE subunit